MQSFDIAIVGGGMVGLALARALKNTGIRIAIVEGSQPSKDLSGDPDIRVSALSRASETILKNLDAMGSDPKSPLCTLPGDGSVGAR